MEWRWWNEQATTQEDKTNATQEDKTHATQEDKTKRSDDINCECAKDFFVRKKKAFEARHQSKTGP